MPDLRIAAQSPELIEREIAKLIAASDAETQKAQISKATYTEEMRSKATHAVLRALGSMIAVTSQQNGGNKPVRSFDELKAALSASEKIPNGEDVWNHLSERQPPFYISKDTFEFGPAEATRTGTLLMRERAPRQLPDGQWARTYLTSDFHVNEQKLQDGNFAAWEKENF